MGMFFPRYHIRMKQGFTLIELLVVVSITSILVALLLPSLQEVRRQAQSLSCMTNLKEIALDFNSFLYEPGSLKRLSSTTAGAEQDAGFSLTSFIDKEYEAGAYFPNPAVASSRVRNRLLSCPASPTQFEVLRGPHVLSQSGPIPPDGISYGFNARLYMVYRDRRDGSSAGPYSWYPKLGPNFFSGLADAGKIPLVTDMDSRLVGTSFSTPFFPYLVAPAVDPFGVRYKATPSYPKGPQWIAQFRHAGKKANVSLCDGSVSAGLEEDLLRNYLWADARYDGYWADDGSAYVGSPILLQSIYPINSLISNFFE